MGLGRYLRRSVAKPVAERIDSQNQLLAEMHLRSLLASQPYDTPGRLEPFGFSSFSQYDEDGILQEIFRRIGSSAATFVEFGVADGLQNNSRLLLYRGWRGLWIEADAESITTLQHNFEREISSNQLQVTGSLVSPDNINELIAAAGLGEIDLLSIDIDGNDYWVWNAIAMRPRVVVIEYNARFRPPTRWVMGYSAHHRWQGTDYHGASLEALAELGRKKGYSLVACCIAGVNAFFVRDDLIGAHFARPDTGALYNPPRYYLQTLLNPGHPTSAFGPYQSE